MLGTQRRKIDVHVISEQYDPKGGPKKDMNKVLAEYKATYLILEN